MILSEATRTKTSNRMGMIIPIRRMPTNKTTMSTESMGTIIRIRRMLINRTAMSTEGMGTITVAARTATHMER